MAAGFRHPQASVFGLAGVPAVVSSAGFRGPFAGVLGLMGTTGTAPVVVTPTVTRISGVKRRIHLSDFSDKNARQRASEFIKQQLQLDAKRAEELSASQHQTLAKADLSLRKIEAEREKQEQLLLDNNNRILLMLLGSE